LNDLQPKFKFAVEKVILQEVYKIKVYMQSFTTLLTANNNYLYILACFFNCHPELARDPFEFLVADTKDLFLQLESAKSVFLSFRTV
jgi:hypothetical protein